MIHVIFIIMSLAVIAMWSLNGLGPKYIADMLTEYKPNHSL